MKIQKYKKDFSYSYTLGAFPTIELIKFKKDQIINVYIHSSFSNKEIRRSIFDLLKGEDKLLEMSNIQHVDFAEHAFELVEIVVDDDKLSTTILATIFCTYLWTQKLNIDILWYIEQKLRYNETREYRHGKKY